jgi:hypothetical protein
MEFGALVVMGWERVRCVENYHSKEVRVCNDAKVFYT